MTILAAELRLLAIDDSEEASEPPTEEWTDVCPLEQIAPDTGVCALFGRLQMAVVRVGNGEEVHALDNFDPFSKASVLSRGIVGDRGGVPTIASPVYKQRFDLRSGQCLDDPKVRVAVFDARVRHGLVQVLVPSAPEDS